MAGDVIGVGMIGLGTVGSGVAELLRDQGDLYAQRTGKRIELRRVLVRDVEKAKASGLVDPAIVTDDQEQIISAKDIDVVIEVAGGVEPIDSLMQFALEHGKHVVTANKSLLAAKGPELFAVARDHGVSIAFEASCGGGIPCVTAMTTGLMANRIDALFGILNGTCNYILTEMTGSGKTYAQALAEAQEAGFAEADPALDVSGQDAAQKLAILASLAFGVRITGDDVHAIGVDGLDLEDITLGDEMGYDIKLLAIAERWPGSKWVNIGVQPCFIKKDELLAQVAGPYNALSVHGHAAGHTLYYGQGAGQLPTASAVVSDLLGIVSGSASAAFSNMRLTPDLTQPAHILDRRDTESAYYLRMQTLDVPGVMAEVTSILGDKGISLSQVLQHESKAGEVVSLVVTTHLTRLGDVEDAAEEIAGLEPIQGEPVIIRVIEMPA
ncbi:MAG: homoserine dehydrogenase [Phycisphaeraceae bacterium]|nr:homoserine dehydrogenase [Phycisphaeraceae bacterium]